MPFRDEPRVVPLCGAPRELLNGSAVERMCRIKQLHHHDPPVGIAIVVALVEARRPTSSMEGPDLLSVSTPNRMSPELAT